MKKSGRRRKIHLLAVVAALSFPAVADAVCYNNVDVYYPDGSAEHCSIFCTIPGGIIKSGCTSL